MIQTLMHFLRAGFLLWVVALGLGTTLGAVPQLLNHQGRVAVNGVNFVGNGQFKFALVNATGSTTYWSNDGTSSAGSQPTDSVTLAVTKGLYSALLGDTTLANMTVLPLSAFEVNDVRLRIWFNDGSRGFQLITPDQRLAATPYALLAAQSTSATGFTGSLAGDVIGTQGNTTISAATVTGKALTGYVSSAGTLSATDTILSAINKLNGNDALKANSDSPTFTGTVQGITAAMVGLGNVTNTSDGDKPVSTAQLAALNAKAPLASPTFTGTVQGITAAMVGLGNVTNTSDADKPVSTAQLAALNAKADLTALALKADVSALDAKAPLASPTFTGTVQGITAAMVGLGNVTNTSDADKPVSTAQLSALNAKADLTALALKADVTALTAKAPLASPTFTGTVTLPAGSATSAPLILTTGTNLSTAVFGSVEFDGTHLFLTNNSASPSRKTIAFTDSALASGAVGSSQLASGLTLGGTTTGTFSGPLTGNVTGSVTGSAASFTGSLSGEVTGTQGNTTISTAAVTGKPLTGYLSGAGTLSATDTILSAINKLNGNVTLKAPLDSPTFTGTVSGITASMVGLGNVSNTSDENKPVSSAQQTALDFKANLASPAFTGTVSGITASMVGLGNVSNTSDENKPVSLAQQTALDFKANLASPTFTGTVSGITASMVGLGNVSNTSDANKPVSLAQQTALDLKAPLASPTFTGTVSGITASMVGLGNVSNTSDENKPVSSAQQTALDLKANLASPSFTGTVLLPAGSATSAPLKLAAGISLTTPVFGSVEFDGTNLLLTNNAGSPTRKTLAFTDAPTFTGVPLAPTASSGTNTDQIATTQFVQSAIQGVVGAAPAALDTLNELAEALNDDASYASTITNALSLKAPLASPTFTGTVSGSFSGSLTGNVTGNVSGSAASFTGTLAGDVTGTQGATVISTATVTGKALTGYLSETGTISATDTILSAINKLNGNNELKANLASPTFSGTVTGSFSGPLSGNATTATTATNFSGSLSGDVTGTQSATAISATTVTGKALTGYVSGAGTLSATDTILTAINKLNGNDALKANLASPTFSGTVTGSFSGPLSGNATTATTATNFSGSLSGDVTGTQSATAISATTVTGKALTGYVSGAGTLSATDTILTAINKLNGNDALKANLASPTFTGTVALPAGSTTAAPLRLTAGTNLTTATLGSVEFDGNNLYLTTNAASPTRKTVALSDTGSSSQIGLSSVVAAPLYPVVAWGNNSDGQARAPFLANVAAVAAGDFHSIALLDDGQVVEWGQSVGTKPTLTGVTDIAAGGSHNLVRQSNGRVLAWGANGSGQATAPTDIVTAVKVAAGARHSLALLANGTVRGWGEDYLGKNAAPASLTGMTVIAIAAGENHSLALKNTGEVVAWGDNVAFQTDVPAGALSGVTAIAAGWNHNLALKSDGSVVAWGNNNGGQTDVPAAASSGVVQIAAGDTYSMALKADGTIVTWGFTALTDPVTVVPTGTTQVTQIAAGGYHALALRADTVPVQLAQLDSSGRLGIGRTPLLNALEVNGNASKSTAGSWLANSDRRIKTEIESITGALEKLDQVRLVDFRYTKDYLAAHPEIENRRYPNVIAQEFQKVFPDDVKGSGETLPDNSEILQVDTYPLTIYSAAAVQELHRENRLLKKKLDEQEQRLRKLEKILKNK